MDGSISPDRRWIETRLRRNVEAARDQYEQALREFELILEQFPLAVPSSDGVLQLRNAGAARSEAMERYQLARHRFHDLLLNDIVPDELDDSDGST